MAGLILFAELALGQPGVELNAVPRLGQRLFRSGKTDVGVCASAPAQLDRCFKATVNGVSFTVGYRAGRWREHIVTYVYTDDPLFRSPEGLRVGDVITLKSLDDLVWLPGFYVYGRSGRGWIPVVGFNGQVDVVHDGPGDERREVTALGASSKSPLRLRIGGFTLRR
jgi:hypothetical protein